MKRRTVNEPIPPSSSLQTTQSNTTITATNNKSTSSSGTYSVGDRVKGKVGSYWYAAVVRAVNADGSYYLQYDDGDKDLTATKVRKFHIYSVGDRVMGDYESRGLYYPCTISKLLKDGSYKLAYDDGDKERHVSYMKIRPQTKAEKIQYSGEKEEEQDEYGYRSDETMVEFNLSSNRGGISAADQRRLENIRRNNMMLESLGLARPSASETLSKPSAPLQQSSDGIGAEKEGATGNAGKGGSDSQVLSEGTTKKRKKEVDQEEEGVSFTEGDKVSCNFNNSGNYYPGVIVKVNDDGSYNVNYDDGDKERGVEGHRLRMILKKKKATDYASVSERELANEKVKVPTQAVTVDAAGESEGVSDSVMRSSIQDYVVGQRVLGKFGGTANWYRATISKVNRNNTYSLEYDDGDKEGSVSKECVKAVVDKGTRVMGKWRAIYGEKLWYRGTCIRNYSDSTYDIHYDDGDKENHVDIKHVYALPAVSSTKKEGASEAPKVVSKTPNVSEKENIRAAAGGVRPVGGAKSKEASNILQARAADLTSSTPFAPLAVAPQASYADNDIVSSLLTLGGLCTL